MPAGNDLDGSEGSDGAEVSVGWWPFARQKQAPQRAPFGERLRGLVLRPAEPVVASTSKATRGQSLEELEAEVRSANDKERLLGLVAAPIAAAIGILVISALIVNDPPARLKDGQIDTLHVSLSLYHDLGGVILALSVLMLVTAMWRKRLFLGIVTALYGLAIFNLHYWGFGVPFILFAAWLLVRSYRLQRDLREATADGPSHTSTRHQAGGGVPGRTPPRPNKRYMPPR
jgi:hypothetical protein